MSLYKDCLQVVRGLPDIQIEDCTALAIPTGGQLIQSRKAEDDFEVESWYCDNVFYISDIHLEHQIAHKFPERATATQIKSFVKGIAKGLFVDKFLESINSWGMPIVLFGGDIASTLELAEIFYNEFIKQWDKLERPGLNRKDRYIYAVIGNHELWPFIDLKSCYEAYQSLFDTLGISFLNNSITWFGKHRVPQKRTEDKSLKDSQYEDMPKEAELAEYKAQLRYIYNTMIVGGIGFAGYNEEFNANSGIYRETIDREREIEESQKWRETYHKAMEIAKENNSALIVLSHHPISDWSREEQPYSGCVYFSGHTHRNYSYHDEDTDIHVFANNQIGYKNVPVRFKQAYIYQRKNPFVGLKDGYHEINSYDYLRFYDYMGEHVAGNGFVERQIKNNNAVFYLVKHEGYYGFFLMSSKGAYICAGGRIKKIGSNGDIEQYDRDFSAMIYTYMRMLSPYRNAQEQIAEAVKSFGGDGTIHGCIIDVDFFNHVMLNPSDGTITYYTSPAFGLVKPYNTMAELLHENNRLLEREYKKQLKLLGDSGSNVLAKSQLDVTGEMVQIDIKNSVYAISNRMNQLQRLFDKKILRDWNDELLIHNTQDGVKGLE